MMELLQEIKIRARKFTDELTALRREFHQYPELSHQEEGTAGKVADYLRDRKSVV